MMERRVRAAFTGYYGMRNFGDDLFGAVCASAARRFWNACPMLVGPVMPAVDSKFTLPDWYPPSAYGAGGPLGKATRLYSFVRGLCGADMLVLGGGSVINGRTVFREPMMLAARRRGRLQLAAIGVSVGPFQNAAAERSARTFIRGLSYLAVRDHRSHEVAAALGAGDRLYRGRDLAGLLPTLMPTPPRAPLPTRGSALRIGVAPCNHVSRHDQRASAQASVADSLVPALHRLGMDYTLQVDVFSLNEHPVYGDAALCRDLLQQLGARGISARHVDYRHCDPLAAVQAISQCHAFISTRLHGAIVAYLLGLPFMIVAYHPKSADFADDIGLPAACRITTSEHSAAAFTRGLEAMLDGQARPALGRAEYARQAHDMFRQSWWEEPPT